MKKVETPPRAPEKGPADEKPVPVAHSYYNEEEDRVDFHGHVTRGRPRGQRRRELTRFRDGVQTAPFAEEPNETTAFRGSGCNLRRLW